MQNGCRCPSSRPGLLRSGLWRTLWLLATHFSFLEKLNLSLSELGKTAMFYKGFLENFPYYRNQIFDYLKRANIFFKYKQKFF